jgi:hypothetical protein
MAKYKISQEELGSWSETSVYCVEAESEEEAFEKFRSGEAMLYDSDHQEWSDEIGEPEIEEVDDDEDFDF